MMADLECPYCHAEQEVCHDDGAGYDEGVLHEMECSECGKSFTFQTTISFSYEAFQADCLNEGEHELRFSAAAPREYSNMRCSNCDYSRRATPDEIETFLKGEGHHA